MFSSAVSSINKVDVEYHSEIQFTYMQSPETGWHMVSVPIEAVVTGLTHLISFVIVFLSNKYYWFCHL